MGAEPVPVPGTGSNWFRNHFSIWCVPLDKRTGSGPPEPLLRPANRFQNRFWSRGARP